MKFDVAVIGGGLSGLSAAVALASRGVKVGLFEQTGKLGGRCYSYIHKETGDVVDNGQHVLTGAYTNTLRYLELIGTRSLLATRQNLSLTFFQPDKGFGGFSTQFGLGMGLMQFPLLSFSDRWNLRKVASALKQSDDELRAGTGSSTVKQWMDHLGQSADAQDRLWNPIAVSVMNELPENASAWLFARALKSTFGNNGKGAEILIPSVGQTELYCEGVWEFLQKMDSQVFLNTEIVSVTAADNKVVSVAMRNGETIEVSGCVCAVPPFVANKLLPREGIKKAQDDEFRYSPIVSIHLWFDRDFMDHDYVGLIGMNLQWVFNRRKIMPDVRGSAGGYLSCVISAAYDIVERSKDEIVAIALADLAKVYPESVHTKLLFSEVIKERRATISVGPDDDAKRPAPETAFPNLFLAGDWTATGLPATIESAIASGFTAADKLCAIMKN
ncbi:MAG TPA: hydroxysqualene dehydroxylase HpnE [Bacteroidota bacterium]|nr:hydroxysqualene dehydroxylase HpnE [Bacteroidota bacterium]